MAGTRDKKRARTETEEEAVPGEIEPTTADDDAPVAEPSIVNNKCSDDFDGDNEDDAPLVSNYKMSRAIFNGHECPYLDSISRQNLDFDFEKCCSVSLSHVNVYVCLVCGKYFQGRGPATHAYTHSLEAGHHLFMKLDSGRVYCLPDMYEVSDRSLSDIQYVLNPKYSEEDVEKAGTSPSWSRALDGSEYMPGLVGLNDMKMNDYANVVFQTLNRIAPLLNFLLRAENYVECRSVLVQRCGELLRKMWNPRAFKGHVSPHEIMQAVMSVSNKRYLIEKQSDPVEFFSWMINTLHEGLTSGKRRRPSPVTTSLQGELEVTTLAGTGKAKDSVADIVDKMPFLMLALDLPPTPLYKDALERVTIPQVPIFDLLKKYDGTSVHDDIRTGRRRLRLTKLPKYLVLHIKRFTSNQFFTEKNPTIVNFPVKGLNLAECVPVPLETKNNNSDSPVGAVYDLVANIVHEGKAGAGSYKVHVYRSAEGVWYEVQDLSVIEVLPQVVALSEAYMQVYQLRE
ncbi:hypothetical protein Ndes2526B_g06006 [Nannochloris sp. 'desiccata']|nr:putative U4/U6.U5 tri-snRNP-associated protein 2 [Chlorella desiccata (nom. nud.)]